MKKYAITELKEIAADVFVRNPKMQNLALTEDGQAFCTDATDANVKNHARQNRYKEPLKIYPFTRADVMPPVTPGKSKEKGSKANNVKLTPDAEKTEPKNDEK